MLMTEKVRKLSIPDKVIVYAHEIMKYYENKVIL